MISLKLYNVSANPYLQLPQLPTFVTLLPLVPHPRPNPDLTAMLMMIFIFKKKNLFEFLS